MDVRLPDGRILRGVPEGTTKEQIAQKLGGKAPSPQQQEGVAKTAFDQGMQGATFGFADEISDRIGAGIASTMEPDLSYDEAYDQARQLTKESQARQLEQHPYISVGANIAGGLLTGGAGATTKAGTAIGNSIRTGNLAARVGKGAAAGAASGGAYGLGSGEDGDRLSSAGRGALFGGVVGGAVPAAAAGLAKLNTQKIYPTFEKVKQAARAQYTKASQLGGRFTPQATDDFIDKAMNEIPRDQFASDVIGEDEVSGFVKRLAEKRGQPMTLETFEELDQKLGDLAHRTFLTHPDLSRKYNNIQNSLRDIVENPAMSQGTNEGLEAFREGTRLWSISSKMRDVQRVLNDSQYYDVPATAIKTGFRRIARDDKKLRGFTGEERKAIQAAAKTGRIEDVLKTFGSRLFAIGSGLVGGIPGAAMGTVASNIGRAGAESLKAADASKISRLLAERTGMVTQKQRLQLPPGMLQKIMAMPPKAARAILDQFSSQP